MFIKPLPVVILIVALGALSGDDALGLGQSFMATTYTDRTNARALYVFAYGENARKLAASFRPAGFGISSNAFVYDFFAATGMVINAGNTFKFTTTMAFLGGTNKFVTRGKKRIASFSDTGVIRAAVAFATGESTVTLCGYAPPSPFALALVGATNGLTYNPTTHLFTLNVSPDNSGTATVAFSLTPVPTLNIASGIFGQFEISWPAAAAGHVLEKATNLGSPVIWSQTPDTVHLSNGQNTVTLTNVEPTAFCRLRQ